MADDLLPLSSGFPDATEAEWLASVDKVLKGRGIDSITRKTVDGLAIHPLYRESDFAAATDPLGTPGKAPDQVTATEVFGYGNSQQPGGPA